MSDEKFTIKLRAIQGKSVLVYLVAYGREFLDAHELGARNEAGRINRGRFVYPTGEKVNARKFDPAKPGKVLRALQDMADQAYNTLKAEGNLNRISLKARIDLMRYRIAWDKNRLSVYSDRVETFELPEGIDKPKIELAVLAELESREPNIQRAIDKIASVSGNELFDFWDDVLSGKVKPRKTRGKPLRKSTIKTKSQTKRTLLEYQAHLGTPVNFDSMNRDFYNRFTKWLADEKGYDTNTIAREVKELKSVLNLARAHELITDDRFMYWPVDKEANPVVTLSESELLAINALDLSGTIDDCRDLFVLACFLGARIGDYKSFKKEAIEPINRVPHFHYVQEKTGLLVKVPVHPIAQKILDKRGGEFPTMISQQNFREYVKVICDKAKLHDSVVVRIRDGKPEYKKKYKAISPHSARRTFAQSLYYGWFERKPMPASLCMLYTGHKTEKSFRTYINANDRELHERALEYFDLPTLTKAS